MENDMELKKKPVTGMKDITPREMEVRSYVISKIRETYESFGFSQIETPCVEHIENLGSRQGGENEKLIFQILKRGEKLRLTEAKNERDLVDSGLRYDLTVPLCRYYANNSANLPSPFKALQMGNVWRADRPQKGRYRQFMQCDIDILGEASNIAETELILATTSLLGKIGFSGFTIRINDRRLLKSMAAWAGFPGDSYDEVFIILDKMDKIGLDGVEKELAAAGHDSEVVRKYLRLFGEISGAEDGAARLKEIIGGDDTAEAADGLSEIISSVNSAKDADFRMVYDPTLVRGMSYYTGPIFEVSVDAYGGSVGGGGRYDEMIGKFTGQPTPACGFSIGFERIVMLMLEEDYVVPGSKSKKVYLLDKKLSGSGRSEIFRKAMEERAAGMTVDVEVMKKNKKFQKEQLTENGYSEIIEVFADKG